MKKVIVPMFVCIFLITLIAHRVVHANTPTPSIPSAVRGVHTQQKWVALTFDDGPYPQYTQPVLNILDKYQAKATFFVVGRLAANYPDLLREMQQRGHEIANHTYTHLQMKKTSYSRLKEEMNHTDQVIFQTTGVHPTLFRPPGGVYNRSVARAAQTKRYQVIMYSIDTKDWSPKANTQSILYEVSGSTRIHYSPPRLWWRPDAYHQCPGSRNAGFKGEGLHFCDRFGIVVGEAEEVKRLFKGREKNVYDHY